MSNTTFTRKNNWQCKKYHESVIVGIERQNLDTVCDEDIQKVVRVVLANGINWQRKKIWERILDWKFTDKNVQ